MLDEKGPWFGAIEAGGTKFICGVGSSDGELIHHASIPTTSPGETLQKAVEFFHLTNLPLAAFGVGTFGPVQLNPAAPDFGFITSTPKPGWRNFDMRGSLQKAFGVPVAIDTDVNAAALAEQRWGAARGLKTFLYVTVGTGIGGGAMVNGELLHGLSHPEMGHIRVPHDTTADPFQGTCPFHGDCLEGLACGPAVQARWNSAPEKLPPDHPAWALQVEYLTLACVNWICGFSPERIVLGGGLMRPHLFPLIQARLTALMNGYLEIPTHYIIPSGLNGRAGVLGALALASQFKLK